MKSICGYSDRFSASPGSRIAFKITSELLLPFRLDIVRLIHGDTNPAGPGYKEQVCEAAVNGSYPGRAQKITAGSYATTPAHPALQALQNFTFSALIFPTMPQTPGQSIVSLGDGTAGFCLSLQGQGGLTLRIGGELFSTGLKFLPNRWYRVEAGFAAGKILLRQAALAPDPIHHDSGAEEFSTAARFTAPATGLVFAARATSDGGFADFFNGKIEAPTLADGKTNVGAWDFSQDIAGLTICDTSDNALHGDLHQLPARAVTGHNWDGKIFDWRQDPTQYAAIHFHEDDLYDAGWESDASWDIPANTKSGLYAARLTVEGDEDYIPFVITPATGATAPILLVIPSASYFAYANEHLALDADLAERVHDLVPVFTPADIFLAEHREYGGSLYDRHADNSGIYYSSRLRPILNMRPKYQSWLGGAGSALWQLNADTHIIDWLEAQNFDFHVISDEDLHENGEILSNYKCVITGTHPEYFSTPMFDAIAAYQAQGGNLLYLGGNGFYWRIAFHTTLPGVIEVRRSEVGNGWITPPGEAHHSFTGEYGGLWRRLGRAPNSLTGVGFIGQGFDLSSYYTRLPASFDARVKFIFSGIGDAEILGDFGLIGGGAAGLELDCADVALGTPAHALVLARSENHTRNYLPTVESLLINYAGQAADQNSNVRADMVFFETGQGGAVFSTGSIAWAGALSHDNYQNNISTITANVIARFIAPEKF